MAQNNYVDDFIKRNGRPLNHETKKQKKIARYPSTKRTLMRRLHGLKGKMFAKKCRAENLEKKRSVAAKKTTAVASTDPIPHFLLDRDVQNKSREISQQVKEKRKDRQSKYAVPLPRVRGVSEVEAFKSITTGKRRTNHWKRMVLKPCFVGDDFTRNPPKLERFIRPMAMRFKKAHVVHPELNTTFNLPIIALKENPHSQLYTNLGILSKGTIIEVNVSELGIVTPSGKVVWGKYAQITNHPENDGCVNAVLLV